MSGAAGRRAFPVLRARRVSAVADFYERLGFVRHTQHPPEGEPAFVGLRRDGAEIAVSAGTGAQDHQDPEERTAGGGEQWEMFVLVDAVDAVVEELRGAGVPVLGGPADMPWGERVAHVADPEGNRVALASPLRE